MRFVERGDCPAVLDNDNPDKIKELKEAGEHFAKPKATKKVKGAQKPKDFEFKLYKHADVIVALEADFYRKCAYCESYYAATQPVDVEHWRPKSEVHEEDGKKTVGYFELALDWDNLLPSCIDCNRARKHRNPDTRQQDKDPLGKGCRFPLANPESRGDAKKEIPLLIHPCKDQPAEHLAWKAEDRSVLTERSDKGRMSIEVYGLNRYGLVANRRDVLFKVRLHLKQLDMLCRSRAKADPKDDRHLAPRSVHRRGTPRAESLHPRGVRILGNVQGRG